MPRVKIVVLIVELTPLPPKGEAGGVKQYVSSVGLNVSEKQVLCEMKRMWTAVHLGCSHLIQDHSLQTVPFYDHGLCYSGYKAAWVACGLYDITSSDL